jgi:hypothetical protein
MGIQVLLAIIVIVVLWLNIRATVAIRADDLSERAQRWLQLLIVWILPLVGALVVLAVHRKDEKPSRQYRKRSGESEYIEDFETGISGGGDASSAD